MDNTHTKLESAETACNKQLESYPRAFVYACFEWTICVDVAMTTARSQCSKQAALMQPRWAFAFRYFINTTDGIRC